MRKEHGDRYAYTWDEVELEEKEGMVKRPVIYLKDIAAAVTSRITDMRTSGKMLEQRTVKVCICGDASTHNGIKTTKISLLIGEHDSVNAVSNALILAVYQGSDSGKHLRKIKMVWEQLRKMTRVEIFSKRVFLDKLFCGDMMFLYGMAGMKGPTATCDCIHCIRTRGAKIGGRVENFNNRMVADIIQCSEKGECGVTQHMRPILEEVPLNQYLPGQVHVICGIFLTFCFQPLEWAIKKMDLVDVVGEMKGTFLDDVYDNEYDLSENIDPDKAVKKALKTVESMARDVSVVVRENKKAEKDGDILIKIFDAFVSSKIEPSAVDERCAAGEQCVYRDKRWDTLNPRNKVEKWVECTICSGWYHLHCEVIYEPEQVINVPALNFVCSGCASSDRNTAVDKLSRVKKTLEEIRQTLVTAENDKEVYEKKKEELTELVERKKGNHQKELESKTKELGADIRAWGQRLTGNHIHTLVKEGNPEELWALVKDSPIKEGQLRMWKEIGNIQHLLRARILTYVEKKELIDSIDRFFAYAAETVLEMSLTPKAHFLRDHVRDLPNWLLFSDQVVENVNKSEKLAMYKFAFVRDWKRRTELWVEEQNRLIIAYDTARQ